jgi:tripartite-type tricarboxylate transporter receptor subunit TctC
LVELANAVDRSNALQENSAGAGTALHLGVELFKQKAGVDVLHVPYRGTAAAMPDLLPGRIAMMLDGVPVQTPNIRAGTLSAVAVTTRQRSPAIPEVATMVESGLDVELPFWTAIYAPIKTPKPIIDKQRGDRQGDEGPGRDQPPCRRRD